MFLRVTWIIFICTVNNMLSVHGNLMYLDKDLFDAVEKGNTTKAAELLQQCENQVSCTIIPDKDYDHYEIWDFVRQPGPNFVKPKVNVINSISSMAPSTVIHMKSPAAQRYLTTPRFYHNTERTGMLEMKYQLSPQTWLSACILRTNGQTICTELIKANSKSTSGGEILELKRNEEDFQVQFRFGCQTIQCVLILRQIKLQGVTEAPTISRQTTAVLSDKAVEIINTVNEMSHYTWIDRGFQGRDLSHLIENAIQQEQDELEALNNPVTPAPSPPPKRPKYSPTTTIPTTTTPRNFTCRPRTTTTTTTTPAPTTPEYDEEEEQDNPDNDGDSTDVAGEKKPGVSMLNVVMAVQLFAFLGKIIGISIASTAVDAIVGDSGQGGEGEVDEALNAFERALPIAEGIIQHLPLEADEKVFGMVRPVMLAGMFFVVKVAIEVSRKEKSPIYGLIVNTKMYDDVVEKSASMYGQKLSQVEETSYSAQQLLPNGPALNLDKDLLLFKNEIPTDLDYDKTDAGPSWKMFFEDNAPKLRIDKFENWFNLDKTKSAPGNFRQEWFLNEEKNWQTAHVTILTKKKPKSFLRSEFYQCPVGTTVRFPVLYQFHSVSPNIFAEVCIKFIYSPILVCSPVLNFTACLNVWCGQDFTGYFNSHPDKNMPFQIMAIIESRNALPENTLVPAVIHIRSLITSETPGLNCQKVERSSAVTVSLKEDCPNNAVPMIEGKTANLSTEYQDTTQAYSTLTEFTFTGQWYKSTCLLDFGNKLRQWNTPFTSILPKTMAISVIVTPGDDQFMASEELKCTTKSVTIDFILSISNPHLHVYVCLYRMSNSVTYSCSSSFQSASSEHPIFQFYSEFAADKIEISVGSRNGFSNGTLTMLIEPIKVVCA